MFEYRILDGQHILCLDGADLQQRENMRECLAIVVLNITNDARKFLAPSYQPAILLQKMMCRDLGTVMSIHQRHHVLDDGGQFRLLSICSGQQTRPSRALIIDISIEVPFGGIDLFIVLFDIIINGRANRRRYLEGHLCPFPGFISGEGRKAFLVLTRSNFALHEPCSSRLPQTIHSGGNRLLTSCWWPPAGKTTHAIRYHAHSQRET